MFGKCRLCLEQRELQRSHLLPKALYRLIGSGTDPDHPDTVQLSSNSIKKSSEQVWRHLLCSECEDRLNKNGEKWVLHNCYCGRGVFRLRAALQDRTPLHSEPDVRVYSAVATEIAQLVYFCLSVIWRASVVDWWCRGEKYEAIRLGHMYQEEIRKYLFAPDHIPEGVSVTVEVSALPKPKLAFSLPVPIRIAHRLCHRFYVPGILFEAIVGGVKLPSWQDDMLSIHGSPHNPICVGTRGDRLCQNGTMRLLGRVAPSGCEYPLVDGVEKCEI